MKCWSFFIKHKRDSCRPHTTMAPRVDRAPCDLILCDHTSWRLHVLVQLRLAGTLDHDAGQLPQAVAPRVETRRAHRRVPVPQRVRTAAPPAPGTPAAFAPPRIGCIAAGQRRPSGQVLVSCTPLCHRYYTMTLRLASLLKCMTVVSSFLLKVRN